MTSWVFDAAKRSLPPCSRCLAWRGDPCRRPNGRTCKPHQEREAERLRLKQCDKMARALGDIGSLLPEDIGPKVE